MIIIKIVIFESVDRAGKTTLGKAFQKETNYEHILVDRMFISQLVYAERYNREIDRKRLIKMLINNKYDVVIVFCNPPIEVIKQRILSTNHEEIDIEADLKLFKKYIEFAKALDIEVIELDTSKPVKELVEELKSKMEELQ